MNPATRLPRVGDRVTWRGHVGTVERVSPEGIHYLVKFDPPVPHVHNGMVDGGCFFYAHELVVVG